VGADLDLTTIQNQAERYWYSRLAYTSTQSIGVKQQAQLIQLAGWNEPQDLSIQARVRTFAATQDPNLWVQLRADQNPVTLYGDMLRPALRPVGVNAAALQNLSLGVTNSGSAATVNSQMLYGVDIWKLPIASRIMRGVPLPADDKRLAEAVGVDLDPSTMAGTLPHDIGTVIEQTYQNRQIASPIAYTGKSPSVSLSDNAFFEATAGSGNELLVLRYLGAQAPDGPDYGVRLRVDQDNYSQVLDVDAAMTSLDEPFDLILPARRRITVHIIATQAAPPAPVPVRVEVWRLSLDTILRVRLGLQRLSAVTAVFVANALAGLPSGATAAQRQAATDRARHSAADLFARIMVGVK
jgi:hypothetical protein